MAMNKLTATDALHLSLPERIQLVEDIWDTIASQAEAMELTEEEKTLLDERLYAHHQDPTAGSPWEDVYQRLTRQHGL
jgi:putative addiction module component (TIGR02574 family)